MSAEQPPVDTDPALASYLVRLFSNIQGALVNTGKLPINKLAPPKPVVGKLYYFSQSIPPDIANGEGLYIYKSTGYEFII